MLFVGWVQLFDVFGIDARIESYTMALGDLVSSVPLNDRIVIVSFDQRSEARLGSPGPGWRQEHARLIDRLVDGGAKVIAFDLFFEKPGSADAELLAAIHRARERGSQVFVGVRQLLAGRPALIGGLSEAASGTGLLCIGGRIAYASIAPLAVVKIAAATASSGSGTLGDNGRFPALGLLAAGAATLAIDQRLRHLAVVGEGGQILWQGPLQLVRPQVEVSGELSNDCPLLSAGDQVAEAMIRLAPLTAWRDPLRRHDFEQLAGPGAGIKPGQLAGRSSWSGMRDRERTSSGSCRVCARNCATVSSCMPTW